MKFVTKSLLTAMLATGLLSGNAFGQQQAPQSVATATQQAESEAFTVTDEQVADFVHAYVAIKQIGQQYRMRIQAAEDRSLVPELQKLARGEMKNAITDTGLGLSEYKQIVLAANHNRTLRGRISAAIAKASQPQHTAQAGR